MSPDAVKIQDAGKGKKVADDLDAVLRVPPTGRGLQFISNLGLLAPLVLPGPRHRLDRLDRFDLH